MLANAHGTLMGSLGYKLHMHRMNQHIFLASLFLFVAGWICLADVGHAQSQSKTVRWQSVIEGKRADLKSFKSQPLDSLEFVLATLLLDQKEQGYYLASVDSVQISDTLSSPIYASLFLARGPQVKIGSLSIEGESALSDEQIRGEMTTRTGRVLSEKVLIEDIDRILRRYELEGYPFARVSVDSIELLNSDSDAFLGVSLRVEEGQRAKINDIVLSGSKRTSIAFVEQITGLRRGDWLKADLDEVQRRLVESQFFQQVLPPQLVVIGSEDVVVQIPVIEEAPGSFDLVLGYQPPAPGSQAQGLVGNGHLTLRNMFGRGRRIALRLNRLPGQISNVLAEFQDPYIFGLPFSIETRFSGLQQDSTYGQQAYQGAVGYKLAGGLETFLTISREVTKPGQSGLRLENGIQRIPRSEVLFAGLSFRFVRVDRPLNPQRGFVVETRFERGSKVRDSFMLQVAGDTTSVKTEVRQERLTLTGRLFVPTFKNQVFVIGNETCFGEQRF